MKLAKLSYLATAVIGLLAALLSLWVVMLKGFDMQSAVFIILGVVVAVTFLRRWQNE